MGKYFVDVAVSGSIQIEVEAEDIHEAEQIALEMADPMDVDFDFSVDDSWCADEDDEEEDDEDYCDDYIDGEAECDSCDCDWCPHYVR